jgi:hypothetical protein
MARKAMVQAGDRHRVGALMDFLVSQGACAITLDDASSLGLEVIRKKMGLAARALALAFLDPGLFVRFRRIKDRAGLQAAAMRNGIVWVRLGRGA